MFDDEVVKAQTKLSAQIKIEVIILLNSIKNALRSGVLHYRKSDGALLKTPEEVIKALIDEGSVILEEPSKEKSSLH